MRKKIFVFAVLLLLTCVSVTDARKRKVQKKETTTLTSERHEIDNFDFLYNGTDYDDYNVSATEDLMSEAFSHIGTRYRSGVKARTPSIALVSQATCSASLVKISAVVLAISMPRISLSAVMTCKRVTWCFSPVVVLAVA